MALFHKREGGVRDTDEATNPRFRRPWHKRDFFSSTSVAH